MFDRASFCQETGAEQMGEPVHGGVAARQCAASCGAGRSPAVPWQSRKRIKPSVVVTMHLGRALGCEVDRTSPAEPVQGRKTVRPFTTV
ncbi:MAG: hypothetical protein ABUL60_34390 [Myxococcales bacterium]